MAKALCWVGMILSLIVFLIFLADISVAVPFQRHSIVVDVVFMVASLTMIWLGWGARKSQK